MFEQLPNASAYLFRNSFYISPKRVQHDVVGDIKTMLSENKDSVNSNRKYYEGILKTMTVFKRDLFVYPAYYRKQYIVLSDKLKCVGIHNV